MSDGMFRKKALGKLASPEQLDELMKVTGTRSWLALVALCAIVATAIGWGIYGSIPTRVSGQGVLTRPTGVFSVPSNSQGPVARVLVQEGDMIQTGQLIAEITQVDLVAQIAEAESELAAVAAQHEKVLAFCDAQRKLKMDYFTTQRAELESDIKEERAFLAEIKKMAANIEILRKQEVASENEVAQIRQALLQVQSEIRTMDDQLNAIPTNETETNYNLAEKRFLSEKAVDDIRRKIQLLKTRLEIAAKILSPYSGRVLEVMVDEGSVVNVGTSILNVEMLDETMRATIFVPDTQGKKVARDMVVEITPSTVKREEYGYILGKVTNVSDFPATREGMKRLLQNESLVEELSSGGVPIQIDVSLALDPKTPSGYKWSSRRSPRLKISSGTICNGSIVVREQPPITLVIPFLKRFFGLT